MTLKTKLLIASGGSLALTGALLALLAFWPQKRLRDPGELRPRAQKEAASAPLEPAKPAEPEAAEPAAPEAAAGREPEPERHAVFAPEEVWTLTGRIVRKDDAGLTWPVEGAAVSLKPHPRRTRPEEAPPPRKVVTGADGRFELAGCPGRLSMRIEIDEPSSAYRAFSFQLGDPDSSARRDLGDIPLEPALTLKIELVGPEGEPIEKGYILVGRETSVDGLALASLKINDSRREARELGGGKYVLERTGAGLHSVKVMAPGCAGAKDSVEVPRDTPFVMRLEAGRRMAGTVIASDGKPIAGAEVELDSGPNLTEPDPKTSTDAGGRFVFDILSDGGYDVSARAEGFASEKKRGVPAGTEDLEFNLAREAVLSGKVVAERDGGPVAGAKVTLAGLQGESCSAESDAEGRFTVRKIAASIYTIGANHRDFAASASEPREIKEGERVEGYVIRLPAGISASGRVVDSATGEPVPDAQVFFDLAVQASQSVQGPGVRRTGRTGADGAFEVKGLGEGGYSLSARAKGYLPGKARKVSIAPGGEKDFTVPLDLGGSIAGRVLDSGSSPIAGATVRPAISFTSPEEWNEAIGAIYSLSALTDGEGRYTLEGLPPHKAYTVTASHKEHAPASAKGIQVGAREALDGVDITLPRGGAVRGRVLDSSGAGVEGASVQAVEENAGDGGSGVFFGAPAPAGASGATDAGGRYELKPLGPGKYRLRAQVKGRMSASKGGVEVLEGRSTDGVDLTVGAGEALEGRVTDADGGPIAGADVTASAGESAQTQTDAEGRFALRGLPKGEARVDAQKQGFEGASLQVTVPAGEVTLKLERSAKIVGTLRAKGQTAFQGIQVIAMPRSDRGEMGPGGGGWRWASRYDSSGGFEVDVKAGTYVLEARAPGFAPAESAAITVKAGERVEGIVIDLSRGGSIRGVVVSRATGEPVEGANVFSMPESAGAGRQWKPFGSSGARSEADGSFTIEGVPDGVFTVSASHERFAQASVKGVLVREGGAASVRIELGISGGIRGLITRGGAPFAGAMVFISRQGGAGEPGVGKQARTDAGGRFEVGGLPAGEYMVSVQGQVRGGGFQMRQAVTVVEGQVADVEIAQASGVRLFGRVTSGGEPVTRGSIEAAQPAKGWSGGNAQIDSSGEYSILVPGAGTYMLMLRLPASGGLGVGGAKLDVTVPPGEAEHRQDIELSSGEISGAVTDAATGQPIRSAEVMALDAGSSARSMTSLVQGMKGMANTDEQGRFTISGLPPGAYSLLAFAQGYADGRVQGIRIDERMASADNRIALERGIAFRARILDPQGRPVQGAALLLRGEDGVLVQLSKQHVSGEDGTVEVSGLRPGVYEVTVVHASFAPSRASVEAADGAAAVLRVERGARLSVEVVNRQGRPVEGAVIELMDDRGENVLDDIALVAMMSGRAGLATAADGTLVIEEAPPGKYRIAARAGEARSREEKITITEGRAAEARLTLPE